MTKYYAAYGSNMNIQQMAMRCPSARVVSTGYVQGRELQFNQVATIVPKRGGRVPVVVWSITPQCEAALDQYEGYPSFYRKENVYANLKDGSRVRAMAYIMNRDGVCKPSMEYFNGIWQGYFANQINTKALEDARERSLQGR